MKPGAQNGRRRRVRWIAAGLSIILVAVAALALWIARSNQPRHVILISFDTTRADFFGCYGNPWIRTPNVDALAAESIVFTDYMTVATTTLASHMSLMTGTYPHTHGVPRNGFVASEQNEMLAEILNQAGFVTAGFLGSFALDSRFNFAQGFDHFDQEFDQLVGERGANQNQRRAETVTDAVIAYLDKADIAKRQFLFVHYFDPHMLYDPPPPYDRMYGDAPGVIPIAPSEALLPRPWPKGYAKMAPLYAGEVSYMDEQVGRLLDYLRRRDILDDALLIVTSDHGELFFPYRGEVFDHGWTVRQSEVHAVGIVRLPGGEHRGARLSQPVCSVDIMPTVLSYLGLEFTARVEGLALDLSSLAGIPDDRVRFAEATKPHKGDEGQRWFNNMKPRCVREGRYKFVQTPHRRSESLFDLSSDPYDRRNLLRAPTPQQTEVANRMRALLADWSANQQPLPTQFDQERRQETIQRLQSLGYLGEDEEADEPNDESP